MGQTTTLLNIFSEKLGNSEDRTNVLVIHGPSASGKITLATSLKKVLKACFKVMIVSTDSFYKSFPGGDVRNFNFDNPGAIEWDCAHNVLKALHDGEETIPKFEYSFYTHQREKVSLVKNEKPNFIIVEGIMALNLFSKECFNNEYDPFDDSKGGFTENKHKYSNFNILKVQLTTCREKMRKTKMIRDITERGRTKEASLLQFEQQSWPATKKWVECKQFKADVVLNHGIFNEKWFELFFGALTEHLTGRSLDSEYKDSKNHSYECSEDCISLSKETTLFSGSLILI